MESMTEHRAVFPLRLRRRELRAVVRDIAAMEKISQNEFIEQAIEHEVVARGALMVNDLEQAAERLRQTTHAEHDALVERSIADFSRGEQLPDPLRSFSLDPDQRLTSPTSRLAAVAAFRGEDA